MVDSFNPKKGGMEGSPQAKGGGAVIKPGSLPSHGSPKKGGDSSSPSEMSGARQLTEPRGKRGHGIPPHMNE